MKISSFDDDQRIEKSSKTCKDCRFYEYEHQTSYCNLFGCFERKPPHRCEPMAETCFEQKQTILEEIA